MKGLCKLALAILVVAACGRDGAITGPAEATAPNAIPSSVGVLAIGVDSTTGASIETNRDDYSPGEVVHLVGRGWAPGESVNLHMTEYPDTHADVDTNVVVDGAGGFSLHFYDVQTHDLGVTFTLTATGATSHSVAVATFTDGNIKFVTAPASLVTSITYSRFNGSNSCGGAPNSTGNTLSYDTSLGLQDTQSILFTIPTVAGYSYTSVTGGGLTITSPTSSSLCVRGLGGSSTGTFTLNYTVSNTAPSVNAGGPYAGFEGSPISLGGVGGATASDADGDGLTYKWTVSHPNIDTGGACSFSPSDIVLNPSVTCTDDSQAAPGTFTLTLEVKDGAGGHTVTDNAELTVTNVKPSANAGGPYGGNVNSSIPLTGSGDDVGNNDDANLTYSWSINNAGIGTCTFAPSNTAQSPTISCTLPSAGAPGGVFTLSLTVSDGDGGVSDASTANLTVTNQAPTSNTGAPAGGYAGNEGSPINISGSGTDPDGGTVSFLWSVTPNDGKCTFGSDNSASTTVTCTDNGPWTLSLKVTDDEGAFTTSTGALNVANLAPTIGMKTLGVNVNEGSSIPFAVGNVTDPSSDDQTAGFTYSFKCGTAPYSTFDVSNTVNCPAGDGPGSIVIRGRAMDDDGGISDEVSSTFTVDNVKPTITAVTTNSPVSEGSDATLTVTTVTDPWAGDLVGAEYTFACDGVTYGAWGSSNSVNCPTTDGPASFTIRAKVKDKDGAESDPFAQSITVSNVPPTVTGVTAPASVNEGPGTLAFSATGVTDPSSADVAFGFQYAFSCDNGSTWSGYSTTNSGSCAAPDGPATITVAVKAKDKDNGESTPVTKSVTVINLKPTVTGVTAPSSVNEGPSFNFSASGVTDPSPVDQAGTFTYAFSCDNGGTWTAFGANSGSCTAPDGPATVDVAVKAKDKDGAESDPVMASVIVNNVSPTVTAVTAPTSVAEGPTPFNFSATGVTDPSTPDVSAGFQYAFSCDNGVTWTAYSGSNSGSCAATDGPGTVNVAVKAKDKDGGESLKASASVGVTNVAPTLTSVTGSVIPVALGSSTSITLAFSDPANTFDTYTASINWDDGNGYVTGGAVTPGGSVSKTFSQAGVNTICAKVSDEDGGTSGEQCFAYVVVYDANGGFVTGGGWINSLAGYYRLNTWAEGKATFGFVSKYVPGKNVPTGNTEFQFHAGSLNFKSTVYEWLVVAGTKAIYKGEGTIAGLPGVYGFLLSAIDGSPDRFRIKIWDKTTGNLVYDTLPVDAADDADPTTTLGGGSIVVHTKK